MMPEHVDPPGEGWKLFTYLPPQLRMGVVVELWRSEWGDRTEFLTGDKRLDQDIIGLWWRPA